MTWMSRVSKMTGITWVTGRMWMTGMTSMIKMNRITINEMTWMTG